MVYTIYCGSNQVMTTIGLGSPGGLQTVLGRERRGAPSGVAGQVVGETGAQ
jgi:hypothetical protein